MMQRLQKRSVYAQLGALALILLCCLTTETSAWSSNLKAFRSSSPTRRRRQTPTMYMPPNTPTSQTAHITAQKMLKNPGNPRVTQASPKSPFKLSNSVLASCDTLPSFPTAHGILSPETVMRMEELTAEGHRSDALKSFLKTYRRDGPLSCLPMLSDPDVLPKLTEAMRDIAA